MTFVLASHCAKPAGHESTHSNEQLLLTAHDGSGWLAALACRYCLEAPQLNSGR